MERFVIPDSRRVAVIEVEADVARSLEDVFDYCSDPMNEPQWNVRMKGVEKVTDGPFGVGARYRMEFVSGPPVMSECVRLEHPGIGEMFGGSKLMRSGWRGRVLGGPAGAHLVLRMEIKLRGLLALATPLLCRRMRPELERDIATIKATLEGGAGRPSERSPQSGG
ncbi:SRPBCC family protein [Kitasatospora camelliae]|uniref:SRPBCC family protein n=1 Tax=Kitasatospora camelliae TaxID=3156397 RepID=A0AAU8K975_9ACTN